MTRDDERREDEHRLVAKHRAGAVTLQVLEFKGGDYWRLVRETPKGPVQLGIGRRDEIESISNVFEKAGRGREQDRDDKARRSLWSIVKAPFETLIEKAKGFLPERREARPAEPDSKKGGPWYAVVRLNELTATGGKGGVVVSFDDLEKARNYRDANRQLALHPQPFAERPQKGTPVEITGRELKALQKRGEGRDFSRQLEVLRWKAEQGKYYNIGHWNERSEEPRLGQLVRFSSGLDYRGLPDDRRVTPLRDRDPGKPENPQLVVFEMSSRMPGVGRVVDLPPNMAEAKKVKKEFESDKAFREMVLQEEQWRTLEVGGGLRAMADREMKSPRIRPAELAETLSDLVKPGRADRPTSDAGVKISTHIKGDFRADVVRQAGEDGEPRLAVVITHEYRDAEGKPRSAGAVFGLDELMAFRRDVLVPKEPGRSQEPAHDRPSPSPAPIEPQEHPDPAPRPAKFQSELVRGDPERSQEPSHDRASHPPAALKPDERPGRGPTPATLGRENEVAREEPKPIGLEPPTVSLEPLAGDAREKDRFWTVGVWHGGEPPVKGNLAVFTRGKEQATERMILPAALGSLPVDPTGATQYVLGRIIAKGVIEIHDSAKDLDHALRQQGAFERRDFAKEQSRERPKDDRPAVGVTNADLEAIFATPRTAGPMVEPPGTSPEPLAPVTHDKDRFWTVGVWHGGEPPVKGDFAVFARGKEHATERMMIPAELGARPVEPQGRPQYILGRIVGGGVLQIHGAAKDLDYALRQQGEFERRDLGKVQGRDGPMNVRPAVGVSKAAIEANLATPKFEPPKPMERPRDMGMPM
ncbi:hypothetical protein [Paludisphaera mucosa]|uniref:DUF3945 domain-containing protein n=1 Tax=Paludisphaera mucosa TaxID=3030827 RepID=A0ABT6FLL0_9BACT|nr:hypothetical protein [Paludisphaera mucosa]MDG3008460.1 hypothetical protein [Paludisphaera mucosa]